MLGWRSRKAAYGIGRPFAKPVTALGFAAGKNGALLKTTDGGANWVKLTPGTTNHLHCVNFPGNPSTGYIVGTTGFIAKSTDGGTTWLPQVSGTDQNLNALMFADTLNGFIVGDNGIILRTTDGGVTGVEVSKAERPGPSHGMSLKVTPNPFGAYAKVPGHESEMFALYDISGRRVGSFKGDRIGLGLSSGVYFLRAEDPGSKPVRIVKMK